MDSGIPTPGGSGDDVGVSRSPLVSEVPLATRTGPPGWRDPRLWIGVALVAASVVAGARIVGSVDDSVGVWAAARDLAPGDEVEASDLVARRVSFEDPGDLDRYLLAAEPLPDDLHLVRGLVDGELVPAAALGSAADAGTVSVSLSFPAEEVPTGVRPGSMVDLWVVDERRGGGSRATPVLTGVVVVDAPSGRDTLGAVGGGRQLVLGVPADEDDALASVLAAASSGAVRVVGRG